tara:strand:+ start:5990 stop:6256 length:267 start_codon:yes stop_codon:yes gene_type:complete
MHLLNLSVTTGLGITFYGTTPREILVQMLETDIDLPRTILEYKEGVAYRAEVCGIKLLFWDETSFLYAMQEAGFITITVGGEDFEEKK